MNKVIRKAISLLPAGFLFAALLSICAHAASYVGYTSLDPAQPITFNGDTVTWNGKTFTLGPKTIFLDYRLDGSQLVGNPYAFNTLQAAKAALTNGTTAVPMTLLVAPGVYWVDDPDDPAIRGADGSAPVGMVITCNNLYFYGLNTVRDNVVFAVNRGQTQGAAGNFTMFTISGTGLKSENVTFGNYCNVDLEFPLAPALGRAKRAEAIAQAQLFNYDPNDGVAINTGFISRLNLLPFATIYLNCHLESSGHASFHTTAMYINSSLEFYNSNFSAGKFFNCDIYITPFRNNYEGLTTYEFGFTDGTGSGGVVVDTRFHRSQALIDNNIAAEVSWDRAPQSPTTRGYQYNVTMDGQPYRIQEYATPGASVIMADGSDQLKAFKIVHLGQTYYNIPNVITGVDPFGYTPAIQAAATAAGKNPNNYYLRIPISATLALVSGSSSTIRSGQTTATLQYAVAPTAYASSLAIGTWSFTVSDPTMATVAPSTAGRVIVTGTNSTELPKDVIVVARNALGVEAALRMTVEPSYVAAPTFTQQPVISAPNQGIVTLDYVLDLGSSLRTDESNITWYRCTSPAGANPLKVAVTRFDEPEVAYVLSEGDVGYYLMATIAPKHNRSDPGPLTTVNSSRLILKSDIEVYSINTNFQNFPTDSQRSVLPGTWIVDGYFAPECVTTTGAPAYTASANSWTFGGGEAGSLNYFGLNQTARGARLAYVPAGSNYGDMSVSATFAPDKTAGQGFGSATQQFMEVYIKFDVASQTGYGLRFQRLNPDDIIAIGYNGDGAVAGVAAWLVKYNGLGNPITVISPKVMTSAFLTECTIELKTQGGRLIARASTTDAGVHSGDAFGYLREVNFDVPIAANGFGGTGMLFTGTVGANSVLVTHWETSWVRPVDVTPRVSIVRGGIVRNRLTNRYAQAVTVSNTGTQPIAGPLALVFDGLSSNAALFAPSGTTAVLAPLGSSFRELNPGPDGVLTPGESVSVVVEFTNPTNGGIIYTNRVLAGAGSR